VAVLSELETIPKFRINISSLTLVRGTGAYHVVGFHFLDMANGENGALR
jgi:hypothetical protein